MTPWKRRAFTLPKPTWSNLRLREKLLNVAVGISGANFMVAETGTITLDSGA